MTEELKQSKVVWSVNGDVECPYCEHYNEFMDIDEWYNTCQIAETKEFKHPEIMTCDKCGKDFLITESEY